jgi:myosin-7
MLNFEGSTFIHNRTHLGENTSFLAFKKNDLIILQENETGDSITNSGWCKGLCERTGLSGDLPAECVYVLPILSKPTVDILVRLKSYIL